MSAFADFKLTASFVFTPGELAFPTVVLTSVDVPPVRLPLSNAEMRSRDLLGCTVKSRKSHDATFRCTKLSRRFGTACFNAPLCLILTACGAFKLPIVRLRVAIGASVSATSTIFTKDSVKIVATIFVERGRGDPLTPYLLTQHFLTVIVYSTPQFQHFVHLIRIACHSTS